MGSQRLDRECGSRLYCPLSKKFLWEELELVREEVTFIYQKLRECPKPKARVGGTSATPVPLSPLPRQRRRKRRSWRTW